VNITIKIIPESEQRACVSGCDWRWEQEYHCDGCGLAFVEKSEHCVDHACSKCGKLMGHTEWLRVFVSPLSNWRHEVLLGLHEAFEAILCKHNGVSQAEVDAFDLEFDKHHPDDVAAGDDPRAPYAREHCFATAAERIMAGAMGISWEKYDRELIESYPGPRHKQ